MPKTENPRLARLDEGAGAATSTPAPPEQALRDYWDADAKTYDRWREHGAWSAGERAAWTAVLSRLLPAGARVLDVGAGTGNVN